MKGHKYQQGDRVVIRKSLLTMSIGTSDLSGTVVRYVGRKRLLVELDQHIFFGMNAGRFSERLVRREG